MREYYLLAAMIADTAFVTPKGRWTRGPMPLVKDAEPK